MRAFDWGPSNWESENLHEVEDVSGTIQTGPDRLRNTSIGWERGLKMTVPRRSPKGRDGEDLVRLLRATHGQRQRGIRSIRLPCLLTAKRARESIFKASGPHRHSRRGKKAVTVVFEWHGSFSSDKCYIEEIGVWHAE